jgi:hypothetical protein
MRRLEHIGQGNALQRARSRRFSLGLSKVGMRCGNDWRSFYALWARLRQMQLGGVSLAFFQWLGCSISLHPFRQRVHTEVWHVQSIHFSSTRRIE